MLKLELAVKEWEEKALALESEKEELQADVKSFKKKFEDERQLK